LVDDVVFDWKERQAKIIGHIPVTNGSRDTDLFHSLPALMGEIPNKSLRFEIDVKV
jgi:hypothetical protein